MQNDLEMAHSDSVPSKRLHCLPYSRMWNEWRVELFLTLMSSQKNPHEAIFTAEFIVM